MSELLIFKGLPYGRVTDSDIRKDAIRTGRLDPHTEMERRRRAIGNLQQAQRMQRFKQEAMAPRRTIRAGSHTEVRAFEMPMAGIPVFGGTVIDVGGITKDDIELFGGGITKDDFEYFGHDSRVAGFRGADTYVSLVAGGSKGLWHSREWWRKDLGRRTIARLIYDHGKDNIGWARRHVLGFNTCSKALDRIFDYGNGTKVNDYLVTTAKADFDAKRYAEHTFDGVLQPTLNPAAVARLGLLFKNTGAALSSVLSPYPWKQVMDYRASNSLPSHADDVKPRSLHEEMPLGDTVANRINGLVVEAANIAVRNIQRAGTEAGKFLVSKAAQLVAAMPSITTKTVTPGAATEDLPAPAEFKPTLFGMPMWIPLTVGGVAVLGLLVWFGRRG